jgi:hypothetical protein
VLRTEILVGYVFVIVGGIVSQKRQTEFAEVVFRSICTTLGAVGYHIVRNRTTLTKGIQNCVDNFIKIC